jgi:hypothetical protein
MNISAQTISLCLELISSVSVPVGADDAEIRMARLVAARRELIGALSGNGQPSPVQSPVPVQPHPGYGGGIVDSTIHGLH